MRYLALDTETTGLEQGDRIIEIAAIEIAVGAAEPQKFHYYLNPGRKVHPDAFKVHGISDEDLRDKPKFSEIEEEFLAFIKDAKIIIHNAPFDVRFINFELALSAKGQQQKYQKLEDVCAEVIDTLPIAQGKFPGQSNSLDALLERYKIDASKQRQLHGALIDAKLLGKVYENMCLDQAALSLDETKKHSINPGAALAAGAEAWEDLPLVAPSAEELAADEELRAEIQKIKAE